MLARSRRPLLAIVACAALLLVAVAALTVLVLRSDARERLARHEAGIEADVRLALWRIDAAGAHLLAREAARAPGPLPPLVLERLVLTPTVPAARFGYAELDAALPREPTPPAHVASLGPRPEDLRNTNEYNARLDNTLAAAGPLVPLWLEGRLVLARRAGEGVIEVSLLDWPALRAELVAAVSDLLPHADLVPAGGAAPSDRRLASLPVVLEPGPPRSQLPPRSREVLLVLLLAWGGALLAVAGAGILAAGVVRLAERRAAFVSAVTHELRTPLTTLRTHAEMIADERVDDAQRRGYAATLVSEADRLRHLVDNVLSFSQIERGRRGLAAEVLEAGAVLERAAPRLKERAASAALPLELEAGDGVRFVGDAIAVEQVLFNLVDNACKYGAGRVVVRATCAGGAVVLSVTDFGPGIPAAERHALFAPFHKPAARAAATAPGVGLGLALCRRLARAMRGELVLESAAGQTTFTLRLPAAS